MELLQEYLPSLDQLIVFSKKIIQSIIALAVGQLLVYLLKRLSKRKLFRNTKGFDERSSKTASALVGNLLQYVIYFFVICQILTIFGVSVSSILAVAGIGSVAIGFGAQSLVKDLLTGIFILLEDEFGVGDFITVGDKSGTVETVGIRATRLRSAAGELHIIPNGEITTVTNLSKGFVRAIVTVPLPYEADADQVLAVLQDEMERFESEGTLSKPVVQGITELGQSSVVVRIMCDCKIGESWGIERELRRLVKIRLEREGIPYPRQAVRLLGEDSDAK